MTLVLVILIGAWLIWLTGRAFAERDASLAKGLPIDAYHNPNRTLRVQMAFILVPIALAAPMISIVGAAIVWYMTRGEV